MHFRPSTLVRGLCLFTWVVMGAGATPAAAQDDPQRTQLGERQRLVERKMAELESRFTAVAEQMREKDPERAERLITAYQQAKEQLITQRMGEIAKLLDARQYGRAAAELDAVIRALDELVRLLLNQRDDRMSKQQEIEMLQRWKENIERIQQEQKRQRQETDKVANKEETLSQLDQQIEALDQLMERQRGLMQQTGEQAEEGLPAMDKLADSQFDLRAETERLYGEISGGQPAPTQSPTQAKPEGPSRPGESGNAEPPQAGDPAGQSEGSSGAGSESKPSATSQPPRPGQQPLGKASQSQQRAEEKLVTGQPTDAQRQQEQALAEMQEARQELERERRRIASLPPEALERMAEEQRRTRDKTMELAQEMSESPQSAQPPSEPQKEGSQGQSPGQQQVGEAGDSMNQAADQLDRQDAQQAERQQRAAERKLQEALDEIEERLNQLREETREEKLQRLEARFAEMLARQRVASVMTTEMDDRQVYLGPLSRRDQLLVMRLSTEEEEIAELGQQAYDLLIEDGTSMVFPEVVEDLRQDLLQVAEFLQSQRTDHLTQWVQRDIEATLEELIEALQEAQGEGGGGGGGGGGGSPPLIKKSAELKMLRANQLRVNRQTRQLDVMRQVDGPDEALDLEIRKTGVRQADYLRILERIIEEGGG